MSGRISSATERAILRVENSGESMYSAARAEGISYSTMWNAMKRRNISKLGGSEKPTVKDELEKAKQNSLLFQKAFVISDKFARFNDEYLENHSKDADILLELIERKSVEANVICMSNETAFPGEGDVKNKNGN